MKITTLSGQEVDTNKLNDKEADIVEALDKLKSVCQKYNVSHVSFAVTGPENGIMCQTISKNKEVNLHELRFIIESMHGYIQKITGGKWGIRKLESPEENPFQE